MIHTALRAGGEGLETESSEPNKNKIKSFSRLPCAPQMAFL